MVGGEEKLEAEEAEGAGEMAEKPTRELRFG